MKNFQQSFLYTVGAIYTDTFEILLPGDDNKREPDMD